MSKQTAGARGQLRSEGGETRRLGDAGGVKTFLTETDDLVGEEKAARLAVGPRYNGAGFEIVCHPTPLDIIVFQNGAKRPPDKD